MIKGILIIATIFSLMASNVIATTFAQGSSNSNLASCAHTVKVTITKFPTQTADASTQMTLSSIEPSLDQGKVSISLPGIGSGQVVVNSYLNPNLYGSYVQNLPGQTAINDEVIFSGNDVCNSKDPQSAGLYLPGIGYGAISITKVN